MAAEEEDVAAAGGAAGRPGAGPSDAEMEEMLRTDREELLLVIHSARGFRTLPRHSLSHRSPNLQAVVFVGGLPLFATGVVKRRYEPAWDAEVTLVRPLERGLQAVTELRVFDIHSIGPDRYVGRAELLLERCEGVWLPVASPQDASVTMGEVLISVRDPPAPSLNSESRGGSFSSVASDSDGGAAAAAALAGGRLVDRRVARRMRGSVAVAAAPQPDGALVPAAAEEEEEEEAAAAARNAPPAAAATAKERAVAWACGTLKEVKRSPWYPWAKLEVDGPVSIDELERRHVYKSKATACLAVSLIALLLRYTHWQLFSLLFAGVNAGAIYYVNNRHAIRNRLMKKSAKRRVNNIKVWVGSRMPGGGRKKSGGGGDGASSASE